MGGILYCWIVLQGLSLTDHILHLVFQTCFPCPYEFCSAILTESPRLEIFNWHLFNLLNKKLSSEFFDISFLF